MRSSSGSSLIVFLSLVLIVLIAVAPRAQSDVDPAAKTLKNPMARSAKS